MKKTKELHVFNDIKNFKYVISETVINGDWWYQREYLKDIWYNDKINWLLHIDLFIDEYEEKWYTVFLSHNQ